MPIVNNTAQPTYDLPGLKHQTIAGPEHGMKTLEVWSQTIAPGASTPVHRHICEEAIVVLEGSGHCTIDGKDMPFGPNSTLVIPSDAVHQIVNSGDSKLVIIAALGMAPVQVRHGDGAAMGLPWQQPA
jgi:mannose-6-phosphate isomerase-like protein (cupin superfamily)